MKSFFSKFLFKMNSTNNEPKYLDGLSSLFNVRFIKYYKLKKLFLEPRNEKRERCSNFLSFLLFSTQKYDKTFFFKF